MRKKNTKQAAVLTDEEHYIIVTALRGYHDQLCRRYERGFIHDGARALDRLVHFNRVIAKVEALYRIPQSKLPKF